MEYNPSRRATINKLTQDIFNCTIRWLHLLNSSIILSISSIQHCHLCCKSSWNDDQLIVSRDSIPFRPIGNWLLWHCFLHYIDYNGANSSLLRVKLSSAAVIIWSVKLAAFLFYRAIQVKEDARLEETLSTTSGVVFFWVISFFWGVISSLPHSLGTASSSDGNDIGLFSGAIVYAVGLVMESVADYQKWTWKQANPGKFCRTGLWSISQHPNFVGNILIWSGITLMNVPSLSWQMVPIACLSPLILWQFFLGQAQGSITSGVELATKKYGGDESYGDYIKSVPLLFPNLKRK